MRGNPLVRRILGALIIPGKAAPPDWTLLGTHNYSPYVDTRPPLTPGSSETREYRLRYLDHDDPVGDYSDIISATTTP